MVEINVGANFSNILQAHRGDWVAFLGSPDRGIWVKGLCMRWNGFSWEQVPLDASGFTESAPYMSALVDLTDGAPGGTFLNLLVGNLVAKTAMVEKLFAKLITLKNTGAIQSENFAAGSAGFRIGADGNAEFNNGTFRGRIEAESGTFSKECVFNGTIRSGALEVDPNTQPFTGSWNSGTAIDQVINSLFSVKPSDTKIYLKSGTYNNTPLDSYMIKTNIVHDRPTWYYHTVVLYYTNGSSIEIGTYTTSEIIAGKPLPQKYLQYNLRMQGQGNLIILNDLPTIKGNIIGSLWRDGEYVKIVS